MPDLPPPELVAGPYRLRSLTAADWPLHQSLSRVPDVVRWTLYRPDMSDQQARDFASRTEQLANEGRLRRYGISSGGEMLGMVGISTVPGKDDELEVFYALLPSGRGRGAATTAVRALSDWALSHSVPRVTLSTIVGNTASERVASRAGFVVEGRGMHRQRDQDVEVLRWARSSRSSGQPAP